MRFAALALLVLAIALLLAVPWGEDPGGNLGELDLPGKAGVAAETRFERGASAATVDEIPEGADWITVRVVDAAGSAVPDLEVVRGTHHSGAGMIEAHKERTDARGECRFAIGAKQRADADRGRRFSFLVGSPIGHFLEQDFDPRDPPEEPVVFTIEAGGRLDIVVLNAQGETHAGAVTVSIRDLDRRGLSVEMHRWFGNATLRSESGRITTPPVALGKRWRITVEPEGRTHASSYVIAEGPRHAGETKLVQAPLGAERPILHAHFLDAEGRPLEEPTIGAVLIGDGEVLWIDTLHSDARQSVRWPLKLRALHAKELRLHVWSPRNTPQRMTTQVLSAPLAPGVTELGNVACDDVPTGVSGRVVDVANAPLPNAWVGLHPNGMHPGEFWTAIGTKVDEQGRFALRVPPFMTRSRFQATLQEYRSFVSDVEYGTPEALALRVVLQRRSTGSISGSVTVAERCHWQVQLRPSHSAAPGAPKGIWFEKSGDRFQLENLEPGTYTLGFAYGAEALEDIRSSARHSVSCVHEIHDLHVPENGACRDPRLEAIDLRGKLKQRRVRVLMSDGEPGADRPLNYALRTSDGVLRAVRGCRTDQQGWLGIHAPAQLESLQIGMRGHRIATLDPRAISQTVRLERGLPLRIELAADAPDLPAGFVYCLELDREEPNDEWIACFHYSGHKRGKLWAPMASMGYEIDVPAPGRYALHWSILHGEGSDEPRREIECSTPATIEVSERSDAQVFHCTPPAAGIDTALQHFDRD